METTRLGEWILPRKIPTCRRQLRFSVCKIKRIRCPPTVDCFKRFSIEFGGLTSSMSGGDFFLFRARKLALQRRVTCFGTVAYRGLSARIGIFPCFIHEIRSCLSHFQIRFSECRRGISPRETCRSIIGNWRNENNRPLSLATLPPMVLMPVPDYLYYLYSVSGFIDLEQILRLLLDTPTTWEYFIFSIYYFLFFFAEFPILSVLYKCKFLSVILMYNFCYSLKFY